MPAIRRHLYDEDVDATRTPLTIEFNFRWKLIKDERFMWEPELRETTKRWIAQYLSVDAVAADRVRELKGSI